MKQSIIAAVEDMFFAAKIRATAEHLGVEINFPKSAETLLDSARKTSPSLVIVDLHSERFEPFALAQSFKNDEKLRSIPLLGFFSHVQTELQQQARRAGFDRILPRSAFAKNLAEILQGNL